MRLRSTPEDDELRSSVAELIIAELETGAFLRQGEFERWAKAHKPIMRDLFGGQGLQNLIMVVAWWRREGLDKHGGRPPIMSHVARRIGTPALDRAVASDFMKVGIGDRSALLKAVLLYPGLARALVQGSASSDGGFSDAGRAETARALQDIEPRGALLAPGGARCNV